MSVTSILVHQDLYTDQELPQITKYKLVWIDNLNNVLSVQPLLFNVSFEQLAEKIEIQSHVIIHISYLLYALDHDIPPFRVGLNLLPNLSHYQVLLTGFKKDKKRKMLYQSIAMGLDASIVHCKTVDAMKTMILSLNQPNCQLLIFVLQPYCLIKLLGQLNASEKALLLENIIHPSLLLELNRELTKDQLLSYSDNYRMNPLFGLKMNTFKIANGHEYINFEKIPFEKTQQESDSNAKLKVNLQAILEGKIFLAIISDEEYMQKYVNITRSTHFLDGKLAICKIMGYQEIGGENHKLYSFTNNELAELPISDFALRLTYSKPIIFIIYDLLEVKLSFDVEHDQDFLEFCTFFDKSVLCDENIPALKCYEEKIIVITRKEELLEKFEFLTTKSCFYFRILQCLQLGLKIKQIMPYEEPYPPETIDSRILHFLPDLLFYEQNFIVKLLINYPFITANLPFTTQEILDSVFDNIPALCKEELEAELLQQLSTADAVDSSINIETYFVYLAKGISSETAIMQSRSFDHNYISAQGDSYMSMMNASRIEDDKEGYMVDLSDEVFTVSQAQK